MFVGVGDALQDGIDFANELHPNGQSGLSDRATELHRCQHSHQNTSYPLL